MKITELLPRGKPAEASQQVAAKTPYHILLSDHNHDIRRFSAQALMGSGYQVEVAEDGIVAWETLQTRAFNLLITENNLPGLTGVELVKKLRSAHMALPVIMATAKLPPEALAQNRSFQLAALLPKPFSVEELLETVREVLRPVDNNVPVQIELLPDVRGRSSAEGFRL